MNNKRFRRIKKEIRILGIDDAPFTPRTSGEVMLIGTVFRGGTWLDGVLKTEITIDGSDSTDKIVKMICSSRNKDQLGVIMLDGITFGGFNIVNIKKIYEKTEVPVIVVMRKFPNFERIKKALKRFEDWKERWGRVLEAGKVYKFENDETVYFQICGIGLEDAKEILKISTTRSAIPEPVRAAHIIAAGVETGESRGNA
ncbi:MAG: DUF99 family protein [Methanobacteriaceae archaeon]